MNFSQKPKKNQPPTERFYRSSALFMQLGLVLALVIVYVSLEYRSTKKVTMIDVFASGEPVPDAFTVPPIIIIEQNQEPTEAKASVKTQLIDLEIVPDDTQNIIILDLPPTVDEPVLDIGSIEEVIDDDGANGVPVPFVNLEEAPIFPGCEDLKHEESKACFTKQMSKFVNRNFNGSIAENLNLKGKQRISTQFTIDKNGLVTDVKIRAPHKRLEKEALRVIQKLPEMIPGKQRKKAVPVKYTLPIVFSIE